MIGNKAATCSEDEYDGVVVVVFITRVLLAIQFQPIHTHPIFYSTMKLKDKKEKENLKV